MDAQFVQQLRRIGLSENEASALAVLIEHGGAFPSAIAEEAKLNRTTTYRILETLHVKGLVSAVTKKKKRFYQAEGSKAFTSYTNDQIRRAQRAKEAATRLQPEIDSLLRMATHKPSVKFYEGVEGVKKVYADHVATSEGYEMLAFANSGRIGDFFGAAFMKEYVAKKVDVGITSRGILPERQEDHQYMKDFYSQVPKKIYPEVRYIPAEQFPYESEITMYSRNKVSITNLHKNQIIGVIIEDETTHGMMKMAFELAWKGAATLDNKG